jgi:predicted extracellular nuclease
MHEPQHPQHQPGQAPQDPAAFATLMVATCNMLNLASGGRMFYANQEPYSTHEFERKIDWLGQRIRTLNADVLAVQEVWDEAALKAALGRSGLQYRTIAVPGAENGPGHTGAQGTPRVGLVSRLAVEEIRSFTELPKGLSIEVPGIGQHTRFERPPLLATLRMKHGQRVHVLTCHLKSKRPKFLLDVQGAALEDRDDPKVAALATLRSLIMRGTEATALRYIVVDLLQRTNDPLVVMGDFNDAPHSVTTQLVAATSEVAYNKAARDVALFNAYEVQGESALKKDVAYSHVHQGYPEVLDQILVSEEFVPGSRFALGDVRRVDYFNDHLHEGRDRSRSDHGFVRALLRLRVPSGAHAGSDGSPSSM